MSRDDSSSLEPATNTDTWDSPDLESRYASMFPLKINREHLVRPNAFLLYAGFAGPWNWERTVMYQISAHLETVRSLLRRDPTQFEVDAMVEHTSREVNMRRTGLPIGLTAGSIHAYYTLRRHLDVPKTTSLFGNLQTIWQATASQDRRSALVQASIRFGCWTFFTYWNFGAVASTRFTWAISGDPRLTEFRGAIQRYAEARMQKIEGYREKLRQRREGLDATRHATANAEEPSEATDSLGAEPQTNAAYDNRQWQTQVPSRRQDNTDYSSSSSSSTQDFFDDASPTAPEYQKPASPPSNENAWARIRRDNSSSPRSTPYSWGQQQATSIGAQNSQSSSEGGDFSSYANEEQKGQRERDAAQREFDRMLEAERQLSRDGGSGSGGDNKKGWKPW